jgi:3-hydroxyacyl-CoA dehydrogenase
MDKAQIGKVGIVCAGAMGTEIALVFALAGYEVLLSYHTDEQLARPMGPFELMDATTSSLCLQAQEVMHEAHRERFRPRPLLKQRVRAGFVGGRNNQGWRTKAGGGK